MGTISIKFTPSAMHKCVQSMKKLNLLELQKKKVDEKNAEEYRKTCHTRARQRIQHYRQYLWKVVEELEEGQGTAWAGVRISRMFTQGVQMDARQQSQMLTQPEQRKLFLMLYDRSQ